MSRVLKSLFLVCSAVALAGCQGPLPPSYAVRQPAVTDQVAVLDLSAPVGSKPQDEKLVATAQKPAESQTGELADSLFGVFKTFTGH